MGNVILSLVIWELEIDREDKVWDLWPDKIHKSVETLNERSLRSTSSGIGRVNK